MNKSVLEEAVELVNLYIKVHNYYILNTFIQILILFLFSLRISYQ